MIRLNNWRSVISLRIHYGKP